MCTFRTLLPNPDARSGNVTNSNFTAASISLPMPSNLSGGVRSTAPFGCPLGMSCQAYVGDEQTDIAHVINKHGTILHESWKYMEQVDPADTWGNHVCNICRHTDRKIPLIRHLREQHKKPDQRQQPKCPFCHIKTSGMMGHMQRAHEQQAHMMTTMAQSCRSDPLGNEIPIGSVRCLFCHKNYVASSIKVHLYRVHSEMLVHDADEEQGSLSSQAETVRTHLQKLHPANQALLPQAQARVDLPENYTQPASAQVPTPSPAHTAQYPWQFDLQFPQAQQSGPLFDPQYAEQAQVWLQPQVLERLASEPLQYSQQFSQFPGQPPRTVTGELMPLQASQPAVEPRASLFNLNPTQATQLDNSWQIMTRRLNVLKSDMP